MSVYQKFYSQKISSLIDQLKILNVSTQDNQDPVLIQLQEFPQISLDNIEFFKLFQNLDTKSIFSQLQVKNYHVFNNNYFLILLIILSYQNFFNQSDSSQDQNNNILEFLRDYQSANEQRLDLRSGPLKKKHAVYQKILELVQNNNDIFVIASSNVKDIIKNQNVNKFIDDSLDKYKNDQRFKKILNIINDFQKSVISKDENDKFNIDTQNIRIPNILRHIASILDEESLLTQIQSDIQNQRFSIDDFTEVLQNILFAIHQNIDPDTFQKSQQMFIQFQSYVQSGIDLFGQQIIQFCPSIRRHHLQKILEFLKIVKLGFESIDKKNFQHNALKTKILELQKQRSKKPHQTQIRIKQ